MTFASLTIQVDLVPDDHHALLRYELSRTKALWSSRRWLLLWVAAIVGAALLPPLVYQYPPRLLNFALAGMAFTLLVVGWYSIHRSINTSLLEWPTSSDLRSYLGPITYHFSNDGIVFHSTLATRFIAWHLVSDIDVTDAHLLIRIDENRYFIVPRRDVPSASTWSELPCTLQAFRQAASGFVPRCPECHFDLSNVQTPRCPECGWATTTTEESFAPGSSDGGLTKR